MAKIDTTDMLGELQEAKGNYLSAIAVFEDVNLDQETKDQVASIIQENQIHEIIALDEFQN